MSASSRLSLSLSSVKTWLIFCNHPSHRWARRAGPTASMGHCCWTSVRFPCRSVNAWTRAWRWLCTTLPYLLDGAYWVENKPATQVRLQGNGLHVAYTFLTLFFFLVLLKCISWRNKVTNYSCISRWWCLYFYVCLCTTLWNNISQNGRHISMKLGRLSSLSIVCMLCRECA